MKILVTGAGATGGYFGARLSQAGRDVTFLVRPRRAEQLRGGLKLIGPEGEETVAVHTVTADRITAPYDLVIIAVKAGSLAPVLDQIAPAVGPDTLILPFLNGMAHMPELNLRFGAERVLGGLVRVVTTVTDSGAIHQLKPIATMDFGPQDGMATGKLEEIREQLDVPGYELTFATDIVDAMWKKWAFITAAGVVTCLMRGSIGDIMAAGGQPFIDQVIAETERVAAAAGHEVTATEHAATVHMLTEPGSVFTSSLYRDVAAGLPHEGEHLLGHFAATAAGFGLEVPLTSLALLQLRTHDRAMARA
ncbi:ketopantoate reductase family protein [Arthrobacter ginkgonis]|uniref:2-dehydropantoate 2-reductase n=1 Tax=Arthrobacter ginkgonis TaxID=1630594 RepID=A0ABP7D8L3_9MICC